jgi:hypothetical protein
MEITEDFKKMIDEDIENLKDALADISNTKTFEYAKLQFYKELTAKYDTYVPNLGSEMYNYFPDNSFYDDVEGETLHYNLYQIYNKLTVFKATGYPSLIQIKETRDTSIVLNANYTSKNTNSNFNENNNTICVSFGRVSKEIESMTSLTEVEIEEILHKINELEQIVQSTDRKSKKWEDAKGIIKWIADKGVDIGISMLPLLLQIK